MNDVIFDKLKKLKEEIIGNCEICSRQGFIEISEKTRDLKHIYRKYKDCKCMKKFKWTKSLLLANIPEEYWNLEFDSLESADKTFDHAIRITKLFIKNLDNALKYGLGILFYGHRGTGKTTLANIILKAGLKRNYTVRFYTLDELSKLIRQYNDAEKLDELKSDLENIDILAIDELGGEYRKMGSDFVPREFENIFRLRKSHNKVNIITTNMSKQEITRVYREGIVSLFGALKKVFIGGQDYRQEKISKNWGKLLKGIK